MLHPATILPAVQKNIPVLVLNSRNAENEGTRITALATHCRSPFKSIAAKRRLTIIDLVASRMLMSHGYLRAVFEVFDKHKCAVDMVSTSEVSVSLTVDSNEQLPELAAELSKLADVTYEGRKALICLVGGNIRGQNGIAAQVFHAVRHINVRMISQGASETEKSKWLLISNKPKHSKLPPAGTGFQLAGINLPKTSEVLDLGVTFNSKLNFSDHISSIIGKAKQKLFLVKKIFVSKNPNILIMAFKTYVIPLLEHCSQVWNPHTVTDIRRLESVQRLFTKRLPGFQGLGYMARLQKANLYTLELRRMWVYYLYFIISYKI